MRLRKFDAEFLGGMLLGFTLAAVLVGLLML